MTTLDLDALERAAWNCNEWPQWLHDIVDRTNDVADRQDMSTEQAIAYGVLSAIGALQERVEGAEKALKEARKPDTYWSYDDPECGWDSFEEPLREAGFGNEVVRLLTGKTLGEVWAANRVLTVDDDGDPDETEAVCFDNPHDAGRCWEESLRAARTKAGERHAEQGGEPADQKYIIDDAGNTGWTIP